MLSRATIKTITAEASVGPVRVPKLYNGHDKDLLFSFPGSSIANNQGGTQPTTLPTDADEPATFSALLGASTGLTNPCDNTPVRRGQIFDPSTASCPTGFVGGRIAFPGNKITNLSAGRAESSFLPTVHSRPG